MGRRRRLVALIGAVAVVGSLLVVVPALGDAPPDAVRLHLGTDGQYFEYGSTRQNLTSTRCEVNELSGPLVALGAEPGGRKVGLNSYGIGVKTGGSQGTPCGRVDTSERLVLSVPTTGVMAGRSWSGLRLDLELKGNAWVVVEMYQGTNLAATHQLATGSSIALSGFPNPSDTDPAGGYVVSSNSSTPNVSCASPSDSGPDSGANDNCQWTIDPGVTFNRIVMKTLVGEFSLEGSGDYANNPDFDTLFYLANSAPVAADDSDETDEDTSKTVDVLANDDDSDGDDLVVTAVDAEETKGTVTIAADGKSVDYDPDGKFEYLNVGDEEEDSFEYTVSDGKGGTDTATVTVTVTGVNDAPVGVIGSATTNEDETKTITVGTDVDDDVLTAECSAALEDETLLEGATIDDNSDGTVDFTPPLDFNGTVILTCTITDAQGEESTSSAVITVTVDPVNDAPVAVDDVAYTDGSTPVTIEVLANDTDVDGDTLSVSGVDASESLGSVEIAPDGTSVTYTPPSGFLGSDTFRYKITDGELESDWATVTVYELFNCGETLATEGNGIEATYTRLFVDDCEGKTYEVRTTLTDAETELEAEAGLPTVVFEPALPVGCGGEGEDPCPRVPFSFSFTDRWRPVDQDGPQYFGTLEIDPDSLGSGAPFDRAPECVSSTVVWTLVDGEPFATITAAELPSGSSWCWAVVVTKSRTNSDGTSDTRSTWYGYGEDDPAKRAS
jgi:VCBS repeat-containing protein